MNNPLWILAFDASCGRCRRISKAVARVAGERLKVLPLTHPDVTGWRRQGLGKNPPWAPTLLRVSPTGVVRGWAGMAIIVPMVRLLGIRSMIELLRALGSLHRAESARDTGVDSGRERRLGLLPMGVVAVLVGWLMVNGKTGSDGGASDDEAYRWVEENLDRLPQDYDGVIAQPINYRLAIYAHLSPEVRSQLWSEQLRRYTAQHPELTSPQRQVLDTALAFTANAANFAPGAPINTDQHRTLQQQATTAFGRDQAARLFAVLGSDVPTSQITPAGRRGCTCATSDDWCDNSTHCDNSNQCDNTSGCGWWGASECNGLCIN